MSTLKGQNFRILTYDSTADKWKVIGMATSCTVTLTGNSDESSTKDDVGLASKPEITSKSWAVSVDSLNVQDITGMLTAMKSMSMFTLKWDETDTTDNQTPENQTFGKQGLAYLVDASFQFNDRTNSTKSLRFTGVGELSAVSSTAETAIVAAGSYTKGQYVRLFLGSDNTTTPSAVIAAARELTLHVALSLENATTKDTEGDFEVQEPTGLSYDISTSALVRSNDTITASVNGKSLADLQTILLAGTPVKWEICTVVGANNRNKGIRLVGGSCVLTQLETSGPNRQVATFSAQMQGYGEYTVNPS